MSESIEELQQLLGRNVQSLRRQSGLTQIELAERANVALGALKALEHGRNTTTETLLKVLRVLDRSDWIRQLSPSVPTFSPLALLAQRERATRGRKARRGPVEVAE